jgi:1-acyl-sn-glycerol-3-phosphate acyltransferase
MIRKPDFTPSIVARALAWPRSVIAYLLLSSYILIVGPPALLVATLFRWPGLLVALGLACVRVLRRIVGLRYQIEGLERVTGDRATVYCINHASDVDVLVYDVLHRRCPCLKALYKSQLNAIPILNLVLRAADFVSVERGNRGQTDRAITGAIEMLRRGDSFVIAPEGTRSAAGQLLPFKRGAFVMAIDAQVPIVPVAIRGGRDAMRRGSPVIRPATLHFRIGDPISTAGMTAEDRERLADLVRVRLEDMLGVGGSR